jgi:hypothetical protein
MSGIDKQSHGADRDEQVDLAVSALVEIGEIMDLLVREAVRGEVPDVFWCFALRTQTLSDVAYLGLVDKQHPTALLREKVYGRGFKAPADDDSKPAAAGHIG